MSPSVTGHSLLHRIGKGSYGDVWLARNALGTLRAIKIVRRAEFDDPRPYEREFAGIQKFEPVSRAHEGFVDLLQVGRDDEAGCFYYVMELADRLVPGVRTLAAADCHSEEPCGEAATTESYIPRTLASEVRLRGALPLDECLSIARTLTGALELLHQRGLVHRDIKPSNIIFAGGVAKLADIGLVASTSEARSYVGTEGYIPPEGPGTPQADLYGLGIVLYVLVSGQSHRDFPVPPDDLASRPDHERWLEFQAVIYRAAAADPKERYPDAAAMRTDLEYLSDGMSVRLRHRTERRRRWAARVTACLLAGASVGGLVVYASRPHTNIEAVAHEKLSTNALANRLYDRGRLYFEQTSGEGFRQAADYFEQAIRADPNFAQAHASLALTYTWSIDGWSDNCWSQLPKAREMALKALALDESLPESHAALGMYQVIREWDWSGGEQEFLRATSFKPTKPVFHYFYAECLRMSGRTNEALAAMARAFDLDRLSVRTNVRLADFLVCARRYEEALVQAEQAIALEPHAHSYGWMFRIRALCALNRYAEAIDAERTFRVLWGEPPEQVDADIRRLKSNFDANGPSAYWEDDLARATDSDHFWKARALAQLGRADEALQNLQGALQSRDVWLTFYAVTDWTLDPIRSDRRFREILRAMHVE